MNIYSEISELWEAYRNNILKEQCDKNIGLTNEEEELADIILRVLDHCAHNRFDIEYAIKKKMEYNKTRPYKHGGKKV